MESLIDRVRRLDAGDRREDYARSQMHGPDSETRATGVLVFLGVSTLALLLAKEGNQAVNAGKHVTAGLINWSDGMMPQEAQNGGDEGQFPQTTSTGVEYVPFSGQHIVEPDQNLSVIADMYGTTVAELAWRNGIQNVDLVFEGQVILVPSLDNTQ